MVTSHIFKINDTYLYHAYHVIFDKLVNTAIRNNNVNTIKEDCYPEPCLNVTGHLRLITCN